MVKLTVLYNLPKGADHEEFLRWRTGEHQKNNAAQPGVLKTDFYVVKDTRLGPPKYRYITEAWFPDLETLERSFFDSDAMAARDEQVAGLRDTVFLISEEVVTTENRSDTED